MFLFSGPEFSPATSRLSNRFVKLVCVGVSGLSRRSGFIGLEDFHWVFPFSFELYEHLNYKLLIFDFVFQAAIFFFK